MIGQAAELIAIKKREKWRWTWISGLRPHSPQRGDGKTVRIESRGPGPSERHRQREDRLHQIPLENNWPTLSPTVLALTELEQDETYPLLPEDRVTHYLEEAISFGKNAARGEQYEGDLAPLINRVIQSGVRIRFMEQKGQNSSSWIRAQYRRKPPTIEIYKPSLKQLKQFFRQSGYLIHPDDLIALHLYHEWFHHLESSSLGRTDHRLPKVEKKRWGPLVFRSRIHRLREIAAHAFTQSALNLSWSPLWLDHLLLLTDRGWSKSQIRDHFLQLQEKYRSLTESTSKPPEA
ncbi:hypothetical protein JOD24_002962 [Kroppenstedtia sanguinis]|uniref:Phage integrase family protein n=1 Tax=Kroppenstedtia sanguinis TaxID=1380684 RepID=A0ABW4C6N7_9BACL